MAESLLFEMQWYDLSSAKAHLQHVARIGSEIPDCVQVYGDVPWDYLLEQTAISTKPIKNRLFEVTTCTQGPDQVQEIRQYLEEKLQRSVNAYRHLDELVENAHFICRNADEDGRALRLSPVKIALIRKDIAEIITNPFAAARRKIVADIERLLGLYAGYEAVQLAAIRVKGRMPLQQLRLGTPVADQLHYRQLVALNHKGEGIYFAPVITDRSRPRVLFLDDIPLDNIKLLPQDAIVVQTSQAKYQAHIPMASTLTPDEVTIAQRVLCGKWETDRACIDCGHFRRLPGFINQKYTPRLTVAIRDDMGPSGAPVLFDDLQRHLDEQQKTQEAAARRIARPKRPTRKTWQDFYEPDRSVVDIRYAYHLYVNGWDPEDIKQALIAESEDIVIRKQGHLQNYLDRTLVKVEDFVAERGTQGPFNPRHGA